MLMSRRTSPHLDAITRLTGLDAEAVNELMFAAGSRYLQLQTSGDHRAERALAASPLFWNWWCNQWADRDRRFVWNYAGSHDAAQAYRAFHDADCLARRLNDPINKSYAGFVGQLIDEIHRTAA